MNINTILDLSTNDPEDDMPWDFSNEAKFTKAEKLIKTRGPALIIGCPTVKVTTGKDKSEIGQNITTHLERCGEMYKRHVQNGGYVLHEHPEKASSWKSDLMKELIEKTGSKTYRGITNRERDDKKGLTRTRWITNAELIGEELEQKRWPWLGFKVKVRRKASFCCGKAWFSFVIYIYIYIYIGCP